MHVRPERPTDIPGIRRVNLTAFETSTEADLVDALREQAEPIISLVADDGEAIVGHILLINGCPAVGQLWLSLGTALSDTDICCVELDYPRVSKHALARAWLGLQANRNLATHSVETYGRSLDDFL